MKPTPRGRTALCCALLALVVATAFADVLFNGRTLSAAAYVPGVLPSGPFELRGEPPPPRHLLDPEGAAWVDEPSPTVVHSAVAAGRLPLWNLDEGLGAPLAANPNSAVWSLLSLPINLWPSPLLQDLVWLGRVWLLGCFTLLLARELGLGWIASIAAATALMLSGQTVLWVAHHPLNTDVFVPLALVGGLRTLRGRRGGEPLLSGAVAAGLLGGKPQSAIVAGLFGALWLAAAARTGTRSAPWVKLLRGAALGGAIAAVALLPFAETYGEASGLVRAGRSIQGAGTLPVAGLWSLAAPWVADAARSAGAEPAATGAWLAPGLPYAGITVLALAAFGLFVERRRLLAWTLAATVAFYLLRVHAGWPGLIESLPLVRSVSFVKYCFPLYLGLALLAGLGCGAVRRFQPLLFALVAAELVWLVPRPHPRRVDPFAPAPYVERLAALVAAGGGRIAGPFDLMPPLVSNALGFADLRAIDVLTPAATWNFVTRLISPSRGLTWILADLDPLLVATAPAADLTDVRWILSRAPLDGAELPAEVRAHVSARRTTRLFDELRAYSIATAWLWAGVDSLGDERRFHWTCATPCRFELEFDRLPRILAAGFASPDLAALDVHIDARDGDAAAAKTGGAGLRHRLPADRPAARWDDVWFRVGDLAGRRGAIAIDVRSEAPAKVWIGGLGPSPGEAAEERSLRRELAARQRELAEVVLRYQDETALIYENQGALGPAWIADRLERVAKPGEMWRRLATADGRVAIATADVPVKADALDGSSLPPPAKPAAPAVESSEAANPVKEAPTARLVRAEGADVEIAVVAPEGGVLVVPRLAAPSWRASVDGRPAPIIRVDAALTGVILPPGAREVRLHGSVASLGPGAVVSAIALLLFAALVMRSRSSA